MKKTIYIVDDQREVLETAVLVVGALMPEAEVTGFAHARPALAAVQAHPPDLILSDQLMPEMRGGELLEEVRLTAPGTLRIIMSGFVALDKLTAITSAHQYVAKPFDALRLKEILRRSFAAQERLGNNGLKAVVTGLRSLPSLPQVQHSLLVELEDSRGASATIGQMVAQDAGLSAKVLQLANSPLFGRAYLVTNPVDAVVCLGTNMICAVVLAQTLFKHFQSSPKAALSLPRVWSHCWETAALAQGYGREQGLPRAACEEAFLAGLLHETGRLILIDNFPDQFQEACDAACEANSPLTPHLREVFKATPSQIAAYLLDLWGMPDNVVAALSHLDHPEKEGASGFSITTALFIADHISTLKCPPDPCPPPEWDAAYLRSLGCADDLKSWERENGPAAKNA
jgi:HD-like signal output (HDOD) protein